MVPSKSQLCSRLFSLYFSFFSLSFIFLLLYKASAYQSSSKSLYLFRLFKIISPHCETFHRTSIDVSVCKSLIKVELLFNKAAILPQS